MCEDYNMQSQRKIRQDRQNLMTSSHVFNVLLCVGPDQVKLQNAIAPPDPAEGWDPSVQEAIVLDCGFRSR